MSWGPFNRIQAALEDPGATLTAWSFELDLPDGKYSLSTKVKDTSGNTFSTKPWTPFRVT